MARLTLDECFLTLELTPAAGPRTVKKAFRRLAKRHHPDLQRNGSRPLDFVRVVQAYTTLQREFRLQTYESDARLCPACGQITELFDGLDGGVECADCLLGVSRRRQLLPPSPTRIVRHLPVIGLELLAVGLFAFGMAAGSRSSLVASMMTSVAALAVLAVVCAVVRHVR